MRINEELMEIWLNEVCDSQSCQSGVNVTFGDILSLHKLLQMVLQVS